MHPDRRDCTEEREEFAQCVPVAPLHFSLKHREENLLPRPSCPSGGSLVVQAVDQLEQQALILNTQKLAQTCSHATRHFASLAFSSPVHTKVLRFPSNAAIAPFGSSNAPIA